MIFSGFFVLVNLWGFFLLWFDARREKKQKKPVSNKNLLWTAVFCGSPGILAGIYCFQRKRFKWYGVLFLWLLFLLEFTGIAWCYIQY